MNSFWTNNMNDPQEREPSLGNCCVLHWKGILIFTLPILLLAFFCINDDREYRCLWVIVLMLICWLTNLFPIAVTAMFPILGYPLMDVLPSDKSCTLYFKDTLISFLITIIIAASVETTKLNKRGAICILNLLGTGIRQLHFFFVFTTMLLSTIIPDGIAVAIIFPFADSTCQILASLNLVKVYEDTTQPRHLKKPTRFAIGFFLSIAFAASMGGTGNLTGTPANREFKNIYDARFPDSPDQIDMEKHMAYAFIPMLLYTILMYIMVETTHMGLFRNFSPDAEAVKPSDDANEASKGLLNDKSNEIGPFSTAQCIVVLLLLFHISFMAVWAPKLFTGEGTIKGQEFSYSSIATITVILTFALPSKLICLKCWDESSAVTTPGLTDWKFVNTYVPWDLIFIIGVGGALAEATRTSGLAQLLGETLEDLKDLEPAISIFIVIVLTEFLTNITTNAAVLRAISPGIIQLAVLSKTHPLFFMYPVGLAGNMAFLMPAATASNALVAAFVNIKTTDIICAGIGPSLVSIVVIYICGNALGELAYSNLLDAPPWAQNASSVNYGTKQRL